MSKPGLLTLTIKDKSALYLAYMPYVINGGLFIPTNSSYRLGDEVFIGHGVKFINERHPKSGRRGWTLPPENAVYVGDRATIGTGAIILPGVTIGADAEVGAGAKITKDVPAGWVVITRAITVVLEKKSCSE